MKLIRLFIWICLYLAATRCGAEQFNFIHYNTNNSLLPHDVCYRLMQDKAGFLWISTDDGLVRFDGRDMKVYQKGFKSRFTIATAASKELFLIATWKGGVHRISHDTVLPLATATPLDLKTLSANNIMIYHDLVLLFNFSDVYAFRYDYRQDTLKAVTIEVRGLQAQQPAMLSRYQDFRFGVFGNRMVAYNTTGIFILKGNTLQQVTANGFRHIVEVPGKGIYGLRDNKIYQLTDDLQSATLYRQIPEEMGLPHRDIYRFYMLLSGNIILQFADHSTRPSFSSSGNYAFVNFRTGKVTDLTRSLHINVLLADILTDRDGNGFWLSTDGDGLYHVFEPKYVQYGNNGEFRNPYVTAMTTDSTGHLYIGTKNGIYTLYEDRIQPMYARYMVYSFFRDKNGRPFARSRYKNGSILMTGNKAVEQADKDACFTTPHYKLRIIFNSMSFPTATITDRSGRKWLDVTTMNDLLPVNDLCEDTYGRLWIGNDMGLYVWDTTMQKPEPFTHASLGHTGISKLVPDTSGGLWSGSKNGLFYLKNGQVVLQYDNSNGLSGLGINTLLLRNDHLWIGTQGGLDVLHVKTHELITCKKDDGLIANDVTILCPYTPNLIAAGGSKGISLIDADHPGFSIQKPELIVEQIYIGRNRVTADAPLVAVYHEQLIFNYNVISFIYPERAQFRYRLSPGDPWIETRNKSIVFSNLESGDYQLQLQAKTYNSNWCSPVSFKVTIKDPWWATGPFYILMVLLLGLLVWVILKTRERRYRQKLFVKQQFSELKLKALQTQLNPHFISNALNAIQLLFLKEDEIATNKYLTQFAQLTRLLLESSRTRFITLKDELQIIRHYLSLEKLRFGDRFQYSITVDETIDTATVLIPGVLLQPFTENSINHGIAYLPHTRVGMIYIHIRREEELLHIRISDNGIGRQKAHEIQQSVPRVYQSRSTDIIREISETVNSLPDCFISISTTDLSDDNGHISGTEVLIHCAISHSYNNTYENHHH